MAECADASCSHWSAQAETPSTAGPLSTDEKITAFAFAVTVSLWIFGGAIGVNAVAAALLGLAILLITGVVEWCALRVLRACLMAI